MTEVFEEKGREREHGRKLTQHLVDAKHSPNQLCVSHSKTKRECGVRKGEPEGIGMSLELAGSGHSPSMKSCPLAYRRRSSDCTLRGTA